MFNPPNALKKAPEDHTTDYCNARIINRVMTDICPMQTNPYYSEESVAYKSPVNQVYAYCPSHF